MKYCGGFQKGWSWLAAATFLMIGSPVVVDNQALWVQAVVVDRESSSSRTRERRRIMGTAISYGESPPLSTLPSADPIPFNSKRYGEDVEEEVKRPNQVNNTVKMRHDPDGALQTEYPVGTAVISPVLTFEGVSAANVATAIGGSFIPSDQCIAVGDDQVVQMVNTAYQVYNKQGMPLLAAPMALANIWTGMPNCNTNDGDPIALWDKTSKRWVLMQFAVRAAPYDLCFAVSTTADARGTFVRYELSTGNTFPDYPKMSIWRDKLVLTTVDFAPNYNGVTVYALNLNQMINSNPTVAFVAFPRFYSVDLNRIEFGLLAADVDGDNQPDADAPIPLFGITDDVYPGVPPAAGVDAMSIWDLSVDWANINAATLVFVNLFPTSAFDSVLPCTGPQGRDCIPQLGTTQRIDFSAGATSRFMNRVAYRRFLPITASPTMMPTKQPTKAPTKQPTKAPTKQPTMAPTTTKAPTESPPKPKPGFGVGFGECLGSSLPWRECLQGLREPKRSFEDTKNDAVQATQITMGYESMVMNSGVEAVAGVAGVRWYEVRRDSNGNYAIHQQGTYAPNDSISRFYASIAQDKLGNIGLGYSVSSATLNPGIRVAGRSFDAPAPGVMNLAESVFFAGSGSQTAQTRWGDYSSLMVDPADDCTFWYTNQYLPANGNFNWQTRIGSFFLDGCNSARPMLAEPDN